MQFIQDFTEIGKWLLKMIDMLKDFIWSQPIFRIPTIIAAIATVIIIAIKKITK